jgi:tetratricopeptide (TPR) repeat protein
MLTARTLTLALMMASVASPMAAYAAPAGVAELLRQGAYWKSKGRGDLAQKAYRRVLAVDPGNADARRELQDPAPVPPRSAPVAVKTPVRVAAPTPARARAPVDAGGQARAAGFVALERGDDDTAASRFQAALKARPNDTDALGGLGIVRLRGKRFAEARDLLARASRGGSPAQWSEALVSASFFADLDKAQKARDAGQLGEAESQTRKLIATNGADKSAATALLADILGRQGRFAEAATLYSNAAASTTRGAVASDLRSKASLALARDAAANMDPANAARSFQAAIANDPSDPWTRYEYARFLLEQNQMQAAVAAIQPIEDRASPEASYASALFWNQAGQPTRADSLMSSIPTNMRTAEMNIFLRETKINSAIAQARTLSASGRTNEAMAGLRMVAGYPDLSVATLGTLADAFQTMGDTAEAQSVAQQALSLPTAAPESYASIISVLAQSGQDGAATALIEKMLAASGGNVTPAIGKLNASLAAAQSDRLRQAGQNAQAFDILQAAWSSAPNDRIILGALGRLYQGGGMNEQALTVYDMLLRQTPNDVPTLIGAADAASGARQKGRARDAAARAMQFQPNNPETYLAAARVEQAAGDKGAALKYLKRARDVYGQRAMLSGGAAFPSTNPFANNPGGGGMSGAVNPFALGRGGNNRRDRSGGQAMASAYPPVQMSAPYSAPVSAYAAPAPAYAPQSGTSYGGLPGAYADARPAIPAPAYQIASSSPVGGDRGIADPTLRRIDGEIASLSTNSGPTVTASTNFRARSGEQGLSKLTEIGAKAEIGTTFGNNGRIAISAAPVALDSGTLSRSALARFGTNPTREAVGIVDAQVSKLADARTQHATGAAFGVSAGYGNVAADVGSTPVGFAKVDIQGGVSWSPRLSSSTQVRIYGERRPVTDSVVAYGGVHDPVTDAFWGKVMRNGGGASVSFDRNGNGIYADGAYRSYRGRSVLNNSAIEANVGGYLTVYHTDSQSVKAGANLNYQSYDNDQNYFSFGHGGYFSPQSFVSLAFPVHYEGAFGDLNVTADVSPGYQSYNQDGAAIYPTLPAEQAALDAQKLLNTDVRSRYDSLSKSGFGFAGGIGATYKIGTATKVGGDVKYNSFGQYNELQTNLKITQSIGGQ